MSDTNEHLRRIDERLKSIEDRTRRTETRLTKYLEQQGFEANVLRPTFANGIVTMSNMRGSIKDALDCVPDTWMGPVTVICENRVIAELRLPMPA